MINPIKRFINWLFPKASKDQSQLEQRIKDLEQLTNLQAQVLTTWIGKVKEFRKINEEDVRVMCNAIANLDKRGNQVEELFLHLNNQVAELEQIISGEEINDDEDIEFTSNNPNKTILN